jgi:hypothetical protein
MVVRSLLLAVVACGLLFGQGPPAPQLTVHTQVREDVFAGFMAGDMERFAAGLKKIDGMISENPANAPALAWRGGAELYLAVRAHEAGDAAKFASLYRKSQDTMDQAVAAGPRDGGVLAVNGASLILFAERLPADKRPEVYTKGRAFLKQLEAAQKQVLPQLPVHMKGELLAALAQSSQRLGDADEARTYLTEMVRSLKDTPYERRAQKWLDDPAAAKTGTIVCQTCHDPGRLENVLAAMKK